MFTLSLHDALPISSGFMQQVVAWVGTNVTYPYICLGLLISIIFLEIVMTLYVARHVQRHHDLEEDDADEQPQANVRIGDVGPHPRHHLLHEPRRDRKSVV